MQSYTHFTMEERQSLYLKLKENKSLRKIAGEIGKNVSSISRELKRNRNKDKSYHPWRATILYIVRRKSSKRRYVIESNQELKEWILYGFSQYWSPEIISARWKGKISHKTIYAAVKRGMFPAITPKTHYRRRGKKLNRSHNGQTIHPEHRVNERPNEANERCRIGDWEGDTVYGAIGKGYLLTCVDRKSRYLVAAIAKDRTNDVINDAFISAFASAEIKLPKHTLTLDNGSEFGGFRKLQNLLETTIYFADPHSPWQRGSNENINDLLRFFFPKGINFNSILSENVNYVLTLINNRPRKCLGWLSPIEFINKKCCT